MDANSERGKTAALGEMRMDVRGKSAALKMKAPRWKLAIMKGAAKLPRLPHVAILHLLDNCYCSHRSLFAFQNLLNFSDMCSSKKKFKYAIPTHRHTKKYIILVVRRRQPHQLPHEVFVKFFAATKKLKLLTALETKRKAQFREIEFGLSFYAVDLNKTD